MKAQPDVDLFSNGANEVAVRVAPRLVSNDAIAVHRAALVGSGIAVLSHILADSDLMAGRLTRLMSEFPPARLPMNVFYPSGRNMPLRVRDILDFTIDIVRKDPKMGSVAAAVAARD